MKHKRQHFVPSSYLQAWCDDDCPPDQTPYVWRFKKDGSSIRKKAPKTIFHEKDLYTFTTDDGERDLTIEYNLSRLEGKFASLRRTKLEPQLPLDFEEYLVVMMFLAAMHARTKSYAAHWAGMWEKVLEMGRKMQEWAEKVSPEERKRMSSALSGPSYSSTESYTMEQVEQIAKYPIQSSIDTVVSGITPLLMKIPNVIICASPPHRFITSDNPCTWFDKADFEKPRPFGAGGLISPTIELTLPISPHRMLYIGNSMIVSGLYLSIDDESLIDGFNKRTVMWSQEHCVTNSSTVKEAWIPKEMSA